LEVVVVVRIISDKGSAQDRRHGQTPAFIISSLHQTLLCVPVAGQNIAVNIQDAINRAHQKFTVVQGIVLGEESVWGSSCLSLEPQLFSSKYKSAGSPRAA